MARIDQHEEKPHLLRLRDVIRYQLPEFPPVALGGFRIPVTGQIDEIPLPVYQEMIYQFRLPRRGRNLGERTVVGQHVDKR